MFIEFELNNGIIFQIFLWRKLICISIYVQIHDATFKLKIRKHLQMYRLCLRDREDDDNHYSKYYVY